MRVGIDMWLTFIQVVPNYECYAPSVSKQRSFAFFRFIVFDMYLDIIYVQVHIKIYESTKVKNDLHFKTEGVLLKVSKFIQKPPPQLQQDGASPKLEYWSLRFCVCALFHLHRLGCIGCYPVVDTLLPHFLLAYILPPFCSGGCFATVVYRLGGCFSTLNVLQTFATLMLQYFQEVQLCGRVQVCGVV